MLKPDPVLKIGNNKAKLSRCFNSTYLDQFYCRFRVLKLWPKTPFLQLTYPDIRHAFRGALWPKPTKDEATSWTKSIYFSQSDVLDPLFTTENQGGVLSKDLIQMLIPPIITDLAPTGVFNKQRQERLASFLGIPGPDGFKLHPAMRILLVDVS